MDPRAELAIGPPYWVLAAIAAAALATLILGFTAAKVLRRGAVRGDPAPIPAPASSGVDCGAKVLSTQRYNVLLQALMGTYDLSSSEIVRAHVQKSLRTVGVTPITPTLGEPFDLELHNGVAGVTAPSPYLVFRVARVLRPGWRTDDAVLRLADVEVYKRETT
ncbi:hypothetical protein QFZ23_002292 [Arthrobacter globiformis]|uniref:nucleotide exchange factor GrpE n=1 Tax=Arthrobacter globiformis TaxID=1665 RepID=UPI0027847785|nr:nucleotide exchange factor GrpE [Arthrobacter globiformis]MDQ1058391.1 hypothetical protein [Arthrobacter globiformis]